MTQRLTRRFLIPACAAAVSLLAVAGCSDDDEKNSESSNNPLDPANPTTQAAMIGMWSYEFPAMPQMGLENSLIINLDVQKQQLYSIEVLEGGEKTLFSQDGVWDTTTTTEGRVAFTGQQCEIIDTTADPDTLSSLPAEICGETFELQRPEGEEWDVTPGDLGSMTDGLGALGLDENQLLIINSIQLVLEKQD
ncbi:MAG: hypothetical protein ACLFSB_15345 [Chitinispirillaceae bacterium]